MFWIFESQIASREIVQIFPMFTPDQLPQGPQDELLCRQRNESNRVRCNLRLKPRNLLTMLVGFVAKCVVIQVDEAYLLGGRAELEAEHVANQLRRAEPMKDRRILRELV